MARMTYIKIAQDIASDLDMDTFNSLSDTTESDQIAQIIETTYFNIIDGRDWPHLKKLFRLTQTGASTPTHMTIADNVMDIDYIKYNVRKTTDNRDRFITLTFLEPEVFMLKTDARDDNLSRVVQITDTSGILLHIYNDVQPTFYTSFDEKVIVFDAFDSAIDTTNLLTTKTQAYGKIYPTVTRSDAFFFDLPTEAFSYLLNESKSVASLALKQDINQKAEQHSNTQRRRMSQEAWKLRKGITLPDYGRLGKKSSGTWRGKRTWR